MALASAIPLLVLGCAGASSTTSESISADTTTMSAEKLGPRLREEIRIRREAGLAEGRSPEELSQGRFKVSIELPERPEASPRVSREEAYRRMTRQVERAQEGIVEALRSMGVDQFERLILSNSLVAELTVDQIHKIAERSDVKAIRLVRLEKVTTENGSAGID